MYSSFDSDWESPSVLSYFEVVDVVEQAVREKHTIKEKATAVCFNFLPFKEKCALC